jgi:hypothetical protein
LPTSTSSPIIPTATLLTPSLYAANNPPRKLRRVTAIQATRRWASSPHARHQESLLSLSNEAVDFIQELGQLLDFIYDDKLIGPRLSFDQRGSS